MGKFNNKYRIESARAPWWDYANAGAYFITICTRHRIHYFGEISNGTMQLSHVGILADVFWYEIPQHSKNVELGAFVVMPNHIHGILILYGNGCANRNEVHNVGNDNNNNVETGHVVETGHALSLPIDSTIETPIETERDLINNPNYHPRFRNPGKNTVSSIIGGYKSAVTKHANRLNLEFGWQTRFHDHIIRNENEYIRIHDYILNNPINWNQDQFYKSIS